MVQVLSQRALFSSEASAATPLTRKNFICLSGLSRTTSAPKSKKFFRDHIHMDRRYRNGLQLCSSPWQQNNGCTCTHNPWTRTQITAECLLGLVLVEMSLMQGGEIMYDFPFLSFPKSSDWFRSHSRAHTHTYSFEVWVHVRVLQNLLQGDISLLQ